MDGEYRPKQYKRSKEVTGNGEDSADWNESR